MAGAAPPVNGCARPPPIDPTHHLSFSRCPGAPTSRPAQPTAAHCGTGTRHLPPPVVSPRGATARARAPPPANVRARSLPLPRLLLASSPALAQRSLPRSSTLAISLLARSPRRPTRLASPRLAAAVSRHRQPASPREHLYLIGVGDPSTSAAGPDVERSPADASQARLSLAPSCTSHPSPRAHSAKFSLLVPRDRRQLASCDFPPARRLLSPHRRAPRDVTAAQLLRITKLALDFPAGTRVARPPAHRDFVAALGRTIDLVPSLTLRASPRYTPDAPAVASFPPWPPSTRQTFPVESLRIAAARAERRAHRRCSAFVAAKRAAARCALHASSAGGGIPARVIAP